MPKGGRGCILFIFFWEILVQCIILFLLNKDSKYNCTNCVIFNTGIVTWDGINPIIKDSNTYLIVDLPAYMIHMQI